MLAYVLIQTHSHARGIAGDLRAVPGVVSAEDLTGPYDAIALTRSDSSERTVEGVLARIGEVPGVARTVSAPLVNLFAETGDGEAA